ncbi:MAG: right-handed parallel beta-helix repeat-containing protein, partial [Actinobacteria bacterium]|nr:right-handed parallel beta-helix repeat-containing protein [Actinomycetota bacterium]
GIDVWVDPVAGDDSHDGSSRDQALRTVDAGWQRIPSGTELTVGYRMLLVAGTYPQATSVNYWEDRHGTAEAPIVIEAADGPHTAVFEGDINMFGVSHFSLIGVDIIREGDAFHCESCNHVLLRDVELSGGSAAHETVKVNQSQHVYIERADIHGADDNAVDFVGVQYGHVIDSRIHDAQDWCMYAKGGSAYLPFSGNEVHDCGTGGITAGQGTGFEFMVRPWLNYEAYGIQIVDNVIHDTDGAGLGVAGGYDVVLAYNTLYRVGARSHVVEFVHGRRGCDGTIDVCAAHHDEGGWGSTDGEEAIVPNRHISFVNNIIVNPDGTQSQWQQFQVDGPIDPPASSGVPSPSHADDDLLIAGNVIWNGPADHPLGVGDGCADTNPTCNDAQIRAQNAINSIDPELVDPEHGDFAPADPRVLPTPVAVPDFVWDATPLPIPPDARVDIEPRTRVGAS